MGKRRLARETALKILFQVDVGQLPIEEAINSPILNDEEIAEATKEFAIQLSQGTLRNTKKIDKLIGKFAIDWRVDRMASVDRNILRLAIYEILELDDIPISVSINEAVELAKKYSTEESGKFINGILGNLVRQLKMQR